MIVYLYIIIILSCIFLITHEVNHLSLCYLAHLIFFLCEVLVHIFCQFCLLSFCYCFSLYILSRLIQVSNAINFNPFISSLKFVSIFAMLLTKISCLWLMGRFVQTFVCVNLPWHHLTFFGITSFLFILSSNLKMEYRDSFNFSGIKQAGRTEGKFCLGCTWRPVLYSPASDTSKCPESTQSSQCILFSWILETSCDPAQCLGRWQVSKTLFTSSEVPLKANNKEKERSKRLSYN